MAAAMQRLQDQMAELDGEEDDEDEGEGEEDDMCPLDGLHDPNKCDFDHTEEQVRAWKESKYCKGNHALRPITSQVANTKVATAISSKKCANGDDCRFYKQGRCKFTH
jgi:hypothetical protein